jgi:hypothetical protein
MKGRLDLPKDNALFTYVHRMNNDYETRVIKRTFKGGGMIVPSAMRVYMDIPVSVAPTLTGSVGERPLYYGIKHRRFIPRASEQDIHSLASRMINR